MSDLDDYKRLMDDIEEIREQRTKVEGAFLEQLDILKRLGHKNPKTAAKELKKLQTLEPKLKKARDREYERLAKEVRRHKRDMGRNRK